MNAYLSPCPGYGRFLNNPPVSAFSGVEPSDVVQPPNSSCAQDSHSSNPSSTGIADSTTADHVTFTLPSPFSVALTVAGRGLLEMSYATDIDFALSSGFRSVS